MKHVLKFSSVQAREYFEKITQGKSHNKISDLEIEIEVAKCIEDKKAKRLEKAKCKTEKAKCKKAKCKDESMKNDTMKDEAAKAEIEMEDPETEAPEETDDEEEMCSMDCMEDTVEEAFSAAMDYMRYQSEYLMSEINYLWQQFARHQEGHLPAVKSAEQMSRVVDKLGLDKEYEVLKKVIYAKTVDGNLTVSLLKDEKKS